MTRRFERGHALWVQLDPVVGHEQAGHRPFIIISETRFNGASGTVIGMPLTSRQPRAPEPFTVELQTRLSGEARSWVKITQIRTLDVGRVTGVLGKVASEEVDRCFDALAQVCGRSSRTRGVGP